MSHAIENSVEIIEQNAELREEFEAHKNAVRIFDDAAERAADFEELFTMFTSAIRHVDSLPKTDNVIGALQLLGRELKNIKNQRNAFAEKLRDAAEILAAFDANADI